MRIVLKIVRAVLIASAIALPVSASEMGFELIAEASQFERTGDLETVYANCRKLADQHSKHARCFQFATSPQGRPLMAVVANREGVLTAKGAADKNLPVVLLIAGIHAGEVVGKDAAYIVMRDLLESKSSNALDDVVMLVVPMFNVDGYARFDTNNRPNQRGPLRTGWRVNSQNLNLNRDWLKADAPEMRAMLGLIERWNPLVGVDLHSTNGAQFQHDIAVMVEPVWIAATELKQAAIALKEQTLTDLRAAGSLPLGFYPSFNEYDNPASGVDDWVASPRYSQGYFWMRNMLGMLVEAHSWRPYQERVSATETTIYSVLNSTRQHAKDWLAARASAVSVNENLAGKSVALAAKASGKTRLIDFQGYHYTRTPSAVSGAMMTRYDENKKVVWRIPLADEFEVSQRVTAPKAGYLIPLSYADRMTPLLDAHGIEYRLLSDNTRSLTVEEYKDVSPQFGGASFEGRQRLTLNGQWNRTQFFAKAGAVFVPVNQPKALLVMAMLEPEGEDSLASWGFFNTAFERKEYMEAYVAEAEAEKMLRADSALRKAFEEKLKDEAFANNPRARLDFFYQRHPAWDSAFGLYPVRRVHTVPAK